MTTARFIRLGPAASSPRSPAVPNSSRPANRSVRSARAASSVSAASSSAVSSSRVRASGSGLDPPRDRRPAARSETPTSVVLGERPPVVLAGREQPADPGASLSSSGRLGMSVSWTDASSCGW